LKSHEAHKRTLNKNARFKESVEKVARANEIQYGHIDFVLKGVGRKVSKGRGNGKRLKNNSIKLLPGGATEKRPKNSKKRPKNSSIQSLSTIYAPCMKIRGREPRPPIGDAHACAELLIEGRQYLERSIALAFEMIG